MYPSNNIAQILVHSSGLYLYCLCYKYKVKLYNIQFHEATLGGSVDLLVVS